MADFLHQGIGLLFQIFPVTGERVMFPDMQRIPRRAGNVPLPAVAAEDVLGGTHRPAAHGLAVLGIETLVGLGDVPAAGRHRFHVIDQRLMAFGKIGGFRTPVRHLHVDVVMVVTGPGRIEINIPEPLEVGRKRAGPGAGQEQVTAILEHGFFQIGINRILLIGFQPLWNGQFGYIRLRLAEVDLYPVKHGLVLGDVRLFQGGIIRRGRLGRITVQLFGGGLSLPVLLIVHQVIRLHGDDDHAGIRVLHGNLIVRSGKRTAFGTDQDTAFIIHAVFQGSLPGDDGALGGNSRFKLAVDGKIRAELAGLAGLVLQHQHIGGRAGERFAVIRHAIRLVIHLVDAVPQIQGARKILHGNGGWLVPLFKVYEQIAERQVVAELVRPGIEPVTIPTAGIGAAGPQADFIQGKPLAVGRAENHGPHAAVADGIPFRFPNGGRLLVFAEITVGVLVLLRINNYGRFIRPDQVGGGRLVQGPPTQRNGAHRNGR